jgi:hypothetical protein
MTMLSSANDCLAIAMTSAVKVGYKAARAVAGIAIIEDDNISFKQLVLQNVGARPTQMTWTWDWKAPTACACVVGLFVGAYKLRARKAKPLIVTRPEGLPAGALKHEPESLVDDSPLTVMKAPPAQARVAVMNDGRLEVVGNAFRIDNSVVYPGHVGPEVYLVAGPAGNEKTFPLKDKSASLDTDVEYANLSEQEFSTLGMKKQKVGTLNRVAHVQVVTMTTGRGSVGTLRVSPNIPGMVSYAGSTTAGFSGAAYTAGNLLLGIHLHGGANNGGFEAAYLQARLRVLNSYLPETPAIEKDEDGEYGARAKNKAWQETGEHDAQGNVAMLGRDKRGHWSIAYVPPTDVEDLLDAGMSWADAMEQSEHVYTYHPESLGSFTKRIHNGFPGEYQRPMCPAAGTSEKQKPAAQKSQDSIMLEGKAALERIKQAGLSQELSKLSNKQVLTLKKELRKESALK